MSTVYNRPSETWATHDEIDYLEHIGTWTGRRINDDANVLRRELLQQYLGMLDYRPKSEQLMDFRRLRQHVERLINELGDRV